jgi:hypothetical protein
VISAASWRPEIGILWTILMDRICERRRAAAAIACFSGPQSLVFATSAQIAGKR